MLNPYTPGELPPSLLRAAQREASGVGFVTAWVSARDDAYADQPFVLLQVFGPCLDADETQASTYDGAGPEDIALP